MNSKVPFFILHLSRQIRTCFVHRRQYCNALKPQRQTGINCFEIMTKSEALSVEGVILNKNNQNDADTANEILGKLYKEEFSPLKFIKALKTITMKQLNDNTDSSLSLKSDLRFIKLCELFEANCHKFSPFLLISALKSLFALDVDPDLSVIKTIEKTILQKLDKFDGNDMVGCLLLLHFSKNITDIQREIIQVIVKEIPNKLHDLTSDSSVFKLVKVYDMFDRKNRRRLDFKLAELVKYFSVQYLCKLLSLLSEKQSRNKTLLNTISYSMQNSANKPNLKQTVDVLHALSVLNFPDTDLLLHLTVGRAPEISAASNPSLVSSLLTACGYLRWRHEEIMETCGKWIVNNIGICSSREFVSYILTTAMLNYTSADNIIKHLLPHLKEEKNVPSMIWLDVVWSLAVLGCVDKEMLLGVLRKDFYEPLLDGTDFRVKSSKLKLMNLKSVLKNKHPECVFSCDLFLDSVEVPRSSGVENSKRSVIDALSNFILPEKYMYTNQCTDMGISIDAEFIMNDKGKPLPLSEFGSMLKSPVSSQLLPPNAKRIAVLVLTHKDFTLKEPHLIGSISLARELLKHQGYVVVQIPYNEFSECLTIVKKAHYLQKKITTAIEYSLTHRK